MARPKPHGILNPVRAKGAKAKVRACGDRHLQQIGAKRANSPFLSKMRAGGGQHLWP
jgi:hypothetical protein